MRQTAYCCMSLLFSSLEHKFQQCYEEVMHRDDMITCELIWQRSGSEAAAQGNGATSDEIVIWLHFCRRDPPKMNIL